MAKSGLFDIVGHFDLIKVFKFLPKKDIKILAKSALKAIKKSNMTLEINSAGLRKPIREIYPSRELLEEAFDLGIPISFGSDAHSVDQVGYGYEIIVSLAKDVGYKESALYQNRDRVMCRF
jgi:histidinol-phosphatase (PHP family)